MHGLTSGYVLPYSNLCGCCSIRKPSVWGCLILLDSSFWFWASSIVSISLCASVFLPAGLTLPSSSCLWLLQNNLPNLLLPLLFSLSFLLRVQGRYALFSPSSFPLFFLKILEQCAPASYLRFCKMKNLKVYYLSGGLLWFLCGSLSTLACFLYIL